MKSPKKVLVVESDEIVLVLISHILTRQSYLVHTAPDALEAERLMQEQPYDAILLDLKMPHGGVDLLRKIERLDPSVLRKIIVVTAAISEARRVSDLPLHATVRKPFDITELVKTVRSCIERDA